MCVFSLAEAAKHSKCVVPVCVHVCLCVGGV